MQFVHFLLKYFYKTYMFDIFIKYLTKKYNLKWYKKMQNYLSLKIHKINNIYKKIKILKH